MLKYLPLLFILSFFRISGQSNIVPNSGFELYSFCPNSGAQWNFCTSWNNVNMNLGPGLWGTPDYFNTCGSGGTAPPATFAGTCNPQSGNSMMALVMYNVPYPDYREYLSSQLMCAMQPGNTYTLSFWLSNGTGIKSPWTIKNIGVHFSTAPLSQSGYNPISVIPQCEITTNVISTSWTQYTFTVIPSTTWNYITIGSFRPDASNNPIMSFPNPGGPASSYANYFVDDLVVLAPAALSPTVLITSGSPTMCIGTSATLSATGATNYTWMPGNLTGSMVVVNPTVTSNYTVTGSNGSCNTTTATATVFVTPSPTISSLGSPASVCLGGTSNLLAGGALSYTWQPVNLTGALISVTPAITTIYTVSGTNAAGCISSSTLSIAVVPNPTITINPPSLTICKGNTATLTANGATNYTWSPGGNTTSSVIITPTANITYTVDGNNGTCVGSATVFITATPIPTITASTSSTLMCSGSTATLTATGATTYTWNPGNIVGSTAIVSPSITTVYTVTGFSGSCTDTKTLVIVVDNGPAISVMSTPTTICSASGNSATLTASGATNYTWNPGTVISSSLVITPTITSTYSVTGTNSLGCVSTTTLSYSVTPTPTITIAASSIAICLGGSATFTSNGASTYTWNPGNINGSNVSVTPAFATIYTVTGSNGICISSSTIAVTVNSNPTVISGSSPTLICSGSSSTLSANGALTYTWVPGALNGQTVSVSPSITTNYTVTGTSASGCTASAVTTVSVNATPTINPITTSTAICIGNTATLSVSGAMSYTWNPGNLNGSSIVASPTTTTTYTVVGLTGSCYDTKTISLIVNPLPTISISPTSPTVCNGNFVTLTATGGTLYIWAPVSVSGTSISVAPTVNTTFTATGYNSFGCNNTATATVFVNPTPTIIATANPTNICSGSPSLLNASGAQTYTWLPTGTNGSSLVVTPGSTTTYTVLGTNSIGCTNSQTVSVLVSPIPTLAILSSTVVCIGSNANLIALGALSYTWQPGALTGSNVVFSPTATTVYTLTGVSGICNSIKTFTLVVLPRPTVFVTSTPSVICKGGASLLAAIGANNYTWSPGSSNGNTLVTTPSVTSSYTVTGINAVGCTNTAIATVSVNPNPTITTISTATSVCSGNSVTLTSNGATNYLINPGALTGSINVITPTVNTTYTITGINNFGCTTTQTFAINTLPSPVVNATSSSTLLCNGGSFSLSANGAVNYTWMPVALSGSLVVTTATNAVSVYTIFGESGGCIATSTLAVTVINCNNSVFGMTKAAGKPVLVYNTFYNVDFTVTAVNASTLNLINVILNEDLSLAFPMPSNFSVVSQPVITSQNSGLTINPLFDGVSQISLTSPTTSTLLANKRDTLVFTVRIDPKGYFGPFKNWVIGFGNILGFTVTDTSNNGFNWDPDHDGDPTNNDTITVINLPIIDLFIPDGFTPDGDGKNDVFFIKGLNGRPAKLTIFNRWGNKVYEKNEYDNSWNAYPNVANTLGTNKVPPATYYYIIEFSDGDKETFTGFVVVQY